MTQHDRMEILRSAVATHGQTGVAARIGRSNSAISQILSGKYAGGVETILELVEAEFGTSTLQCPELGEIALATCIEERDKPFKATSSQRVRLFRACQRCPHKGGTR